MGTTQTGGRQVVVLVVEDEALLRLMAVDIVESLGFTALEASRAEEAITLLESRRDIQIVFTDIDMPDGLDGMRMAAIIRDRWPPVELIIVSGKRHPAPPDLPVRGVFFSKPYRREEIEGALLRFAA